MELINGRTIAFMITAGVCAATAGCSSSSDSTPSCEGDQCTPRETGSGGDGGDATSPAIAGAGGVVSPPSTGGFGGTPGPSTGGNSGNSGNSGNGDNSGGATTGSCDSDGERRCEGSAQTSFLECVRGSWEPGECARGTLCDQGTGQCEEVVPDCAPLEPGEAFCDGATRVICGPDLVTVERESCDGGSCDDGQCLNVECGDGIEAASEECDDGNDVDTDECLTTCELATCGDGLLFEGSEECDDANDIQTDSCSSSCKTAVCGDGAVWAGHEACDDGNDVDDDGCPSNCQPPRCGDGYLVRGIEDCEDGNELGGDGCSALCRVEVASFELGSTHSCAILHDGRLKCWGSNEFGQLGFGNASNLPIGDSPDEMGENLPAVLEGPVVAVAAGGDFTCALVGSTVSCWGKNGSGQLGRGVNDSFIVEPGAVDLAGDAVRLCAGKSHACALLDNGSVKCWGENGSGQCGQDPELGAQDRIGIAASHLGENLAAVTLDGHAERIACGDDFSCAQLDNDRLHCWGLGTEGQLGPTSGDYSWSPEYIPINDSLNTIDSIALGGQHGCGWSSAGDVRCWGFNRHGQLAMGHTRSYGLNPSDFSAAWPLAGVQGAVPLQALGAGYNMTCSLAEGDVRCWGENARGALGISNRPEIDDIGDEEDEHFYGVDPLRFRDVPYGSVKAIGVGDYHACALLADGSVACWGDNTKGQLGIGSSATEDLAITDTVAELPAPARIN